ncbi:hypothetical protein [Streptococcus sp. S784/96/1]|uniref:hypothetical protein n=1 Tax=Streptococcus sp. S784/96/1 TaxID=2653499 RepID=UPI001386BE8F|nr:hypothetical protein [Streptococcus sp. S784/96/1]
MKVSSGQFQPELRDQREKGSQDFGIMTSVPLYFSMGNSRATLPVFPKLSVDEAQPFC